MALARVARRPDEFADGAAAEDLERHRDSAALAAIAIGLSKARRTGGKTGAKKTAARNSAPRKRATKKAAAR
ncbi:hypothetical protein RMA73_16895 [Xanthomonas translucens pv. translucens]|uniref:hypothetical protein n=1 Tax=Xanthomonas campestris pv. translucens TaxID=343 RepID=UPI0002F622A4|nr:hypothetical protein [Xanthomonas translucens]KTF41023.1 hypothetical protein OZ12_03870 [Xanthomonas translucens pv. translucens]KWV13473.1 hypothetical protein ATB54_03140 [Xanthomonas translucens]MCC8446705.1 hypothetical protein [Xanthomonas translucens pv. translucens]MCT8286937.1 hypothetical protein [Xanthomonas translucens pv. translucens]MCT8304595.1 hypothetical protein [Xanthomonas translucens pv. translucens]